MLSASLPSFVCCQAMFDLNVLYDSTNPVASVCLFLIYEFIMCVMLLNIMIAIMASSFSKVRSAKVFSKMMK